MRIGPHKSRYPHGLSVSDAHPGNLILMRDGTMVPIDLHLDQFPREAMAALGHQATEGKVAYQP